MVEYEKASSADNGRPVRICDAGGGGDVVGAVRELFEAEQERRRGCCCSSDVGKPRGLSTILG